MNEDKAAFGSRLRALRVRRMLTQQELAAQVGVDQRVVSRWEVGRERPRPLYQRALCAALGVSADELLTDRGTARLMEVDRGGGA